jgi:hypothetical protein
MVGKPLYELDTHSSVASLSVAPVASNPVPFTTLVTTKHSSSHRTPLIKFAGKRRHQKVQPKPVAANPGEPKMTIKLSTAGISFTQIEDAAWHGRPKLSAKEMELITSGGAY